MDGNRFESPSRTASLGANRVMGHAALEAPPLKLGAMVNHPKFGEGVILAVEGAGAHAQASVKFGPEVGVKRLLLSVAPLERL